MGIIYTEDNEPLAYEPQNTRSNNPTPMREGGNMTPKKKSSNGFVIFLIVLILLGAGGYGAYWYFNQPEEVNEENIAYEQLDGNETLTDYEDFLQRYPESPRAREVKERYEFLKKMYGQWRDIVISGNRRDYMLFMQNYPKTLLAKQCEQKIDSLDWVEAKEEGSLEAVNEYIKKHAQSQYLSEAQELQAKLVNATPTTEEKLLIEETIRGFYRAYGDKDVESIYTFITPTLKRFLTRTNATKADVAEIIESTYNEHIRGCKFVVNNDYKITKTKTDLDEPLYKVSFSVDQHIDRDNVGKVFGSYTAEATVTAQFQISSLTMNEVSRKSNTPNAAAVGN